MEKVCWSGIGGRIVGLWILTLIFLHPTLEDHRHWSCALGRELISRIFLSRWTWWILRHLLALGTDFLLRLFSALHSSLLDRFQSLLLFLSNCALLGFQVLLSVGRGNDEQLACLGFLEGLSVDRKTVFFLDVGTRFWGLHGSARSNSGGNRLSYHLDWLLLGTPRTRSSDLNGTAEKCSPVDLSHVGLISTRMRIDIVCFQIITAD